MPHLSLSLVLLTALAAQPPARRPAPPSRDSAVASKAVATTLADSAAVRRLCEAPDSVLSGRKACVLRNQSAFRTF